MSMNKDEQTGPLTERTKPKSSDEVAAQSSLIGPAPESPRFRSRSSNGLEQSVELHIEDLVLHGFALGDRYLVGEAVERELTRLYTERGVPMMTTQDTEIPHLNGGAISVKPGSTAEATGNLLGRAIYGGLSR